MLKLQKLKLRTLVALFMLLSQIGLAKANLIEFEVDFIALNYSINTNSPAGVISGPGPFPAFDFTKTFQLNASSLSSDGIYDISSSFATPFSSDGTVVSSFFAVVSNGAVSDLLIDYDQNLVEETFSDLGFGPIVVLTTFSSEVFTSGNGVWSRVENSSTSGIATNTTGPTIKTSGLFSITQLPSVSVPSGGVGMLLLLGLLGLLIRQNKLARNKE